MSIPQLVKRLWDLVSEPIEEHLHSAQQASPWGAAPVTLTSGGGAYTWGAYSNDIIAAGVVPSLFDLHWVIVSAASANGDFEIEFVYGAADTVACHAAFTRTNAFTSSIALPLMSIRMPAGSRIRARMRDSAGGLTCNVKLLYHEY